MKAIFILFFMTFFSKSISQDFEKGKLSSDEKTILVNELSLLSGKTIDGTKTITV